MADPGFLSGSIVVCIDMTISKILQDVSIAVHCNCKKELDSLRDLVLSIEPMVAQIHQYRLELNRKRATSIAESDNNASAINVWAQKLSELLVQALAVLQKCTQKCTRPRFDVISRYQISGRITSLISEIDHHLQLVPLVLLDHQMHRESSQASSSTSQAIAPTAGGFVIEEPFIVGQEEAFTTLQIWLMETNFDSLRCIGVVGDGGSGKSLLLRTLFTSQEVRDFFSDGFLFWLNVSQSATVATLRNELCIQIAMQTNLVDPNINISSLLHTKRFALFLDDIRGEGSTLLKELGVGGLSEYSNSTVIVSSRNHRALLELGVSQNYTITMGSLVEEKSWDLFAYHANVPPNMDEETAKLVCAKCGGLPLAIKVIGRSMAGITDAQEWELAAQSQEHEALYDRLRWSYDALANFDVNLQLCFLYLAGTFLEDQIVSVEGILIPLWMGEGLLAKNKPGHEDPFEIGRIYVKLLVDRCLIEPLVRDIDGRVLTVRMHHVLRDLAIQIAEREENFYCGTGKGLTKFIENDFSRCTRVFLNDNKFSWLPESWRAPQLCSLLMERNQNLTEIPRKVIASMVSLKVLNLSWTQLQSLPEDVGCLKQLTCLLLIGVPIKRLPASLTSLENLQILSLDESSIIELPYDIHRLRSLTLLSLSRCKDLQCFPCSISGLTSLQYLDISYSNSLWRKSDIKKGWKNVASIDKLSSLKQLKRLCLDTNGEEIGAGVLGNMVEMETLHLTLTMMTGLPNDIINKLDLTKDILNCCHLMTSFPHDMIKMSELRRLTLDCSHLVKMESKLYEFQNLIHFRLWNCLILEELPDLWKFKSLRQLDIAFCPKLKNFPKEFSQKGAFPLLEIFSLVELTELEELPPVEGDALPFLKTFTIMKCEVLKALPSSYFNLGRLQKIRVYGCTLVLENLKGLEKINTNVKVVTISTPYTQEIIRRYYQVKKTERGRPYGEFLCNELLQFMQDFHRAL